MSKTKNLTRNWFFIMCGLAFPAFILLINTNSYFADKHKLGTVYLIAGIALALGAVYCLKKVIDYGGTKDYDA